MKRTELTGDDAKPNSVFNFIFDNAIGPIIILDSSPTAAEPILEEKQIGVFSNKLYFVIGGTLKEISTTDTV